MTDFNEPRTELEWSRRAIINVVEVLQVHAESLTLVGAHAVLLRTMDLDVPRMPTGDGDLGVTPGLVGDVPSVEALLAEAGYEHRTTARPGLWGRTAYDEADGTRSFREKIDLLAPHGLSGVGAVPSGAFLRCSPRTASSRLATPSAWSWPPSTARD